MANTAELAVSGLDVMVIDNVVRVRDGEDTWLCETPAWEAALARLSKMESFDPVDAYTLLCRYVARPVASINGLSRGHWRPLVEAAYSAGLIDHIDVRAFGVGV